MAEETPEKTPASEKGVIEKKVIEKEVEETQPFNEEQQQFLGSWMGRMISKQFDEKVVPLIDERLPEQQLSVIAPRQDGDALEQFQEQVTEKLLGGDPVGAFQMLQNVSKLADQNLATTAKTATDKALTAFKDDPYYKEIFVDAQKMAHEAAAMGHPASIAADSAFHKAKANFLEHGKAGEADGLSMTSGGKPRPGRETKPKLPPQFKAAAKRDIDKGLFKDEADYIANMDPSIRAKYGI